MPEITTNVIDLESFRDRRNSGLYVAIDQGPITDIYCGDERIETPPFREKNVTPARFFGGSSGQALAAATSLVMSHGEAPVRRIFRDYGAEAFVDLAADISHGAHAATGVNIHQHSAEGAERNPHQLASPVETDPLGCKFNAALGVVAMIGSDVEQLGDQLDRIHTVTGTDSSRGDTRLAQESLGIVLSILGGPDVAVTRGHLHHSLTRTDRVTPFVMLAGDHAPNDQTSVVLDLAGYKAVPSLEDPAYHHTPELSNMVLPNALPEFQFEQRTLTAAGIVIGAATQRGLGVPRMDIIPADIAA